MLDVKRVLKYEIGRCEVELQTYTDRANVSISFIAPLGGITFSDVKELIDALNKIYYSAKRERVEVL